MTPKVHNEVDALHAINAKVSKNDIKRRESIHDKLGIIRKCIASYDMDEEAYEIVNNISKELQKEICPWIDNG